MGVLSEQVGQLQLKDFYNVTVAIGGRNLRDDNITMDQYNKLKQLVLEDFIWGYNDIKRNSQGQPEICNNDLVIIEKIKHAIEDLNIDDFNLRRPTQLLKDTLMGFVWPQTRPKIKFRSKKISMWDHTCREYVPAHYIMIEYNGVGILKVYFMKNIL